MTQVIARLTVTRKVGVKTLIEVHSDSTFQKFFYFYTQDGRKRKQFVRTASRNEGLSYTTAYRMTPGLEVLAPRWMAMQHIDRVDVKILRKRAYRRLITASAHELGQAIVRPLFPSPVILSTNHS